MKKILALKNIIILFNSIFLISQENLINYKDKQCPPCEIIYSEKEINKKLEKWPEFSGGDLLKINSLTNIQYDRKTTSQYLYYEDKIVPKGFEKGKGLIGSWWTSPGLDPWSAKPFWGTNYEQPTHIFRDCVNDNLRWMCGYSYVVDIPKEYSHKKKFPLIIYLHGSIYYDSDKSFISREKTREIFFRPHDDPYIFVAPIRLEIDWDAKKILDLIENVKENLSVDISRIYLTGLSMGGSGTFIVAAEYPNLFAAIMPLSPHHGPNDYLPLAQKIKDLPIWMSHGDIDWVSSYSQAKKMADTLKLMNANIKFRTEKNVGHWGWDNIYSDSVAIKWLMSWRKNDNKIIIK